MADSLHESLMRRCLELAAVARDRGEAAVGSVVVRDGTVIAEGIEGVREKHDIACHAEMEAVRRACGLLGKRDLSRCVLYTNAEPCWMCSYAIRACKIGTVVFGAAVEDTGGITSVFPALSTDAVPHWGPPPEIIGGILRAECEAIRKSR